MPEKISRGEKLDALTLVSTGQTRDNAAHLMHISKSTIQRAKRRQKLFGDIEGGKKKRGRRAKFTPEIINVILHSTSNKLTNLTGRSSNDYEMSKLSVEGISTRNL